MKFKFVHDSWVMLAQRFIHLCTKGLEMWKEQEKLCELVVVEKYICIDIYMKKVRRYKDYKVAGGSISSQQSLVERTPPCVYLFSFFVVLVYMPHTHTHNVFFQTHTHSLESKELYVYIYFFTHMSGKANYIIFYFQITHVFVIWLNFHKIGKIKSK